MGDAFATGTTNHELSVETASSSGGAGGALCVQGGATAGGDVESLPITER